MSDAVMHQAAQIQQDMPTNGGTVLRGTEVEALQSVFRHFSTKTLEQGNKLRREKLSYTIYFVIYSYNNSDLFSVFSCPYCQT
jgi:hypothetical protein